MELFPSNTTPLLQFNPTATNTARIYLSSCIIFLLTYGSNSVSGVSFPSSGQSTAAETGHKFLKLNPQTTRNSSNAIAGIKTKSADFVKLPNESISMTPPPILSSVPQTSPLSSFTFTQSPTSSMIGFQKKSRLNPVLPAPLVVSSALSVIWPWFTMHLMNALPGITNEGTGSGVAVLNGTKTNLTETGGLSVQPAQNKSDFPKTVSQTPGFKAAPTLPNVNTSGSLITLVETAANPLNDTDKWQLPSVSRFFHYYTKPNVTRAEIPVREPVLSNSSRNSSTSHIEKSAANNTAEVSFQSSENATPQTTATVTSQNSHMRNVNCQTKVIGYYTSWGTRNMTRKVLNYLTHVNFAFVDLEENGTVWLNGGSAERLQNLLDLRGRETVPKMSLSIGGWGSSNKFANIVRNESCLSLFLDGLFTILNEYHLDGVDVDWEYPGAEDKFVYILFLRKLRSVLNSWKMTLQKDHLLLTFAGAAGSESLQAGFDIKSLLEGDTVDWVNVMAYDFYGPWAGPSGEYTGPISPLFSAVPRNYSQKLNTHWAIEQYICKTNASQKIVLGVPFYGRYWNDVGGPVDKDPMWRRVEGDVVSGGHESFNSIITDYVTDKTFGFYYSDSAKAAYGWSDKKKVYLGYESPKCADLKAQYVIQNNLGGLMIWAVDMDDDNSTLIKALTNGGDMCSSRPITLTKAKFECYEQQWWTADTNANFTGMCGKTAPLFNGAYPVCDPQDASSSCCGRWGYCGGGSDYCDCPSCRDYGKYPEKIKKDAVKPSLNETRWHTMESPERGRCGSFAAKINNDTYATCNPDDPVAPCCSTSGSCGIGWDFCDCPGCVDFRRTPNYRYRLRAVVEKRWWTWADSEDKAGQCGPNAPLYNGSMAICDPFSVVAHCCSAYGYCGTGVDHCQCPTCMDYSKLL